jgi:putative beta-barrel porin BBP2
VISSKRIPRKNSTIEPSLVAFLLLSIAFSSFFFFTTNQLSSAFGEQNPPSIGLVHLHPLVKSHSLNSGEMRSARNSNQTNNSSTKPNKPLATLSVQESFIEIRKLIFAPTYEIETQNWSANLITITNKALGNERKSAIRIKRDNLEQNANSSLKRLKTHKDIRKSLTTRVMNGEISEGAAGALGDFFEGVSAAPSKGGYQIEITPRISIQGEYDDNIFLRKTNIVGDYTTTLSPGINVVTNSDTNGLDLDYEFGWVRYQNRTRNDYVRHAGGLKFWQKLGNHLTFRLEDYYIKSDDILAALNQVPVSQRIPDPETLQAYQRNIARAYFEYQFGPSSLLSAGYVYNFTDNKDPNLEDTAEYGPFANLSYWYNQRNGIEFDYRFLRNDYGTKGTAIETRPDLDRQDILGRYIRKLGSSTSGLMQYGLFVRDFPDVSVNYQIHDFSFGFEHAFSQRTSVALGTGYYRATGDTTIKPGYNFLASLNRNFERGSLALKLVHSFDQGYTEVVPRGFTVYSLGLLNADYSLTENLNLYGVLSYRRNDYSGDDLDILGGEKVPDDQTYRGRCGITWKFYRWVSLDLGYLYTKRISDDPNFDFDDNRVTLRLIGSYPYKW